MTGARGWHLDADFKDFPADFSEEEVLARLRSYDPPPSIIIATGGGYHCLWLHDGVFSDPEWAKSIEDTDKAILAMVRWGGVSEC